LIDRPLPPIISLMVCVMRSQVVVQVMAIAPDELYDVVVI
jgi:hypothetical protein